MLDPLYTAAEMRAAEAGRDVPALMRRAGRIELSMTHSRELAQAVCLIADA